MPAFGLLPSQRLPSPCVGFQITLSIPLKGIISLGGWIADIYLTKTFQAFAAHERISDATVIKAAREIQNKLYDANLGSCVYKKRVARAGGGKRGGYRVLIAFRDEDRLFFMRGFAKNEKNNIANDELAGLQCLAALYLDFSPFRLYPLVNDKKLRRLTYEQNPC